MTFQIGRLILVTAAFVLAGTLPAEAQERRLQVAVTGGTSGQGPDNPFVLLNDPAIEALVLEAASGPVSRERVDAALTASETGAGLSHLVSTGILRPHGEEFAIAFNLFTIADQQRLDELANQYGASLADAIEAEWPQIDAALSAYDVPGVERAALAYILIGCFALDWDGLAITREAGYRTQPFPHGNGDIYTLSARERGEAVSLRGYYWGSHNRYFDDRVLTSFGDHDARRHAFPDLIWRMQGAVADGLGGPDGAGRAAARAASPYLDPLLQDVAGLAFTLRSGTASTGALAAQAGLEEPAAGDLLALMEMLGYAAQDAEGNWHLRAVTLDTRDAAMVTSVRDILDRIMRDWLDQNYESFRNDSAGLTPARNGVPYETAFTQYWHYIFGAANRELVTRGLFADPYDAANPTPGALPSIWRPELGDTAPR